MLPLSELEVIGRRAASAAHEYVKEVLNLPAAGEADAEGARNFLGAMVFVQGYLDATLRMEMPNMNSMEVRMAVLDTSNRIVESMARKVQAKEATEQKE